MLLQQLRLVIAPAGRQPDIICRHGYLQQSELQARASSRTIAFMATPGDRDALGRLSA